MADIDGRSRSSLRSSRRRHLTVPVVALLVSLALVLPGTVPAGAAARIDFHGSSTGTGATLTLPRPAGVVAGDLLVAGIAKHEGVGAGGDIVAPPGWRLLENPVLPKDLELAVYVRVADAAEPPDYTWITRDADANGVLLAYSGVDAASPVAALNTVLEPDKVARIRVGSFDVPVTGAVLVMFATIEGPKHNPISPPEGFLAQADRPVHPSLAGSDRPLPGGGPTGELVASAESPASHIGLTLALRPAG